MLVLGEEGITFKSCPPPPHAYTEMSIIEALERNLRSEHAILTLVGVQMLMLPGGVCASACCF